MATKHKVANRTTAGLRDVLFDEIDSLRGKDGDPTRARAVATLSQQIINTAKVELDFHRTLAALADKGAPVSLGTLALGSN